MFQRLRNSFISQRRISTPSYINAQRRISTPSYINALDHAFAHASEYLNADRLRIKDQLQKETDPEKKLALDLQLGFSDYKNHAEYANMGTRSDLLNPLFAQMHDNKFKSDIIPKMLKSGHEYKIFQEVFPEEITPKLNLEINFSNTNWMAANGHPLPPNWAIYSPRFAISTNEHCKRYFTLLMMDLDHPNEKKQYYEEWCHWANIPVEYRLEVDGGSSPFYTPGLGHAVKDAHFIPEAPTEAPFIPGETILPYIPPHPPLSDPRKGHRLLFTLFESKNIGEKIDVEGLKSRIKVSEEGTERPELRSNARSALGTTYKFMSDLDLQVQGYGIFSTVWNVYTPDIFTRLNLHEPVYGSVSGENGTRKVQQMVEASRHYKSNLSTMPLSELSFKELNELNHGFVTPKFEPILLTKERMEIETLMENLQETPRKKKMNRVSVTGASGIVRSRENIKDKRFYS